MNSKKPLLTISLLISNRPDTIPRCLDSLRPIMHAIPSELILIDTSKNEEIHKLLLTYTDKVYEFEWCNDFAKARNEGIRRAQGEWFLYLDDDEWFVDAKEIIDFFRTKEYKNFGSVNMQIRNFSNAEYTKYSDSWVTRLFCLEGGVRFEGKVHEYIYNIHGVQVFLPAMIHHSGYIFDTEEKKRKHFERNSKMLLELIEKEPEGLRWQAQMIQEYCTIDDWESIVEFCQERIKKVDKIDHFMDRNHLCTMYAGYIDALKNLGRHEEFLALCEQASNDERITDLLRATIHLRKAESYVNVEEDFVAAKESVDAYFEYYKNFKKNEVAMREQLGALLINRTFERNYLDTAHNILIYIALKQGDMSALQDCVKRIESKEGFAISVKLANYLVELMATMEERTAFSRILAKAVEDESISKMFCAEAQRWEEKDEKGFLKIAHIYANVAADFWFFKYCHFVDTAVQGDKIKVEKVLEALLKSMPNQFYLPDKVYEIIHQYDIKVALLWAKLAADKWPALIKEFVDNCSTETIDKVRNLICDVYKADDRRVLSLELAFMEKQLIAGPEEQIIEYYDLLKQYAPIKLAYYYNFYADKETQDEIPVDVQAAYLINEYVELEVQDKIQALGKIKEAAETCPLFADGLSKFVHRYVELEEEKSKLQNDEMNALRIQVLLQIRAMIQAGQLDAAQQILQQLLQMFPGDVEVEQLVSEIQEIK